MPTEPPPVTVFQVIRRAVEASEVGVVDERVDDLLEHFEDDDEPVRSVADMPLRIDEALGEIDPDWEQSPLAMTRAVAVYLAFRPDEIDEDAASLLRLAARAEFDAHPPEPVQQWLARAGVEL